MAWQTMTFSSQSIVQDQNCMPSSIFMPFYETRVCARVGRASSFAMPYSFLSLVTLRTQEHGQSGLPEPQPLISSRE